VAFGNPDSDFVRNLSVARLHIKFGEQVEVICLASFEAQGSGSSGKLSSLGARYRLLTLPVSITKDRHEGTTRAA
jgi:hypothetical protein